MSLTEIVEEIAKIDKYYEANSDGSYCDYIEELEEEEFEKEEFERALEEKEVIEGKNIKSYKDIYKELFIDLTDEQIAILVYYSDEFTIKNAQENPGYFISNIHKYINPDCLLQDSKYRQDLFELIMSKKGYTDIDIKKLIDENKAPLGKSDIDIILDSYYEKTKIQLNKYDLSPLFNFNQTKKPTGKDNRYDYYNCDSFAILGNKIYNEVLNNAHKDSNEPIFYINPERIEWYLNKAGYGNDVINKFVLAAELGYADVKNDFILYKINNITDELNQQYRRYKSLSAKDGQVIAMFLLLSGNIMGGLKDIRATLKEKESKEAIEYIQRTFEESDGFDEGITPISKAKSFNKEYNNKRENKLIGDIQKKYKYLTNDQIKEMTDETRKILGYKAPAIRVYKMFNDRFYVLNKTNEYKFRLVISSLVTALGGVGSLGNICLASSSRLQNLLINNGISLQKYFDSKMYIIASTISLTLLFGGSMFVCGRAFAVRDNKEKVEEISREYNLKIK